MNGVGKALWRAAAQTVVIMTIFSAIAVVLWFAVELISSISGGSALIGGFIFAAVASFLTNLVFQLFFSERK